ncbi:hypothetical protein XENTR_v10007040 [Xenopus tropicalis]|nr:hypothetical protein XENTR_v10007040 [Xenopus tropicalis]
MTSRLDRWRSAEGPGSQELVKCIFNLPDGDRGKHVEHLSSLLLVLNKMACFPNNALCLFLIIKISFDETKCIAFSKYFCCR